MEKQKSVVDDYVAKTSHEYRSNREIRLAPGARPIEAFREALWDFNPVSCTSFYNRMHLAFRFNRPHCSNNFLPFFPLQPGHIAGRAIDANTSSTWSRPLSCARQTHWSTWCLRRRTPSRRWWRARANSGPLFGVLLLMKAPMHALTTTLTSLNVAKRESNSPLHPLFVPQPKLFSF